MANIWNQWKHTPLAVALLSATASVFAQAAPPAQAAIDVPGEATVEQPLGRLYAMPTQRSRKAARITLYRLANDAGAGVAHLDVNGKYHTSLQKGGFSEICVEPREFTLAAYLVKEEDEAMAMQNSLSFNIRTPDNFYVRLSTKPNNTPTISFVTDKVALKELTQTRRQVHIASRVSDAAQCQDPEQNPGFKLASAAPPKAHMTLASDALFGFGQYDAQGITATGHLALSQMIADIKQQHGNLEQVHLVIEGHADPIGNPETNRVISEARAQTVRDYLVRAGLNPRKISSVGLGDSDLVVATCPKTLNPENIACNKPNRRVVVVVQQNDR